MILAVAESEPVGRVERDRGVVGVRGGRLAWNDLLEKLVAAKPRFELRFNGHAKGCLVFVGEERFDRSAVEAQCADRPRTGFLQRKGESFRGAIPHQVVGELAAGIVDVEHGLAQIVETLRDVIADADEGILPRLGDVLDLVLNAGIAFGQFVRDDTERVVECDQHICELSGSARRRLPCERSGAEFLSHVLHGSLGLVDIGRDLVLDRSGFGLEGLDVGFELLQAGLGRARRRTIP